MKYLSNFSWLNILTFTLLICIAIFGLLSVPGHMLVTVHWNFSGEADGFMPAHWPLLILPAVGILIVGFWLWQCSRIDPAQFRAGQHIWRAGFSALMLLLVAVELLVIKQGFGHAVNALQMLGVTAGVLFAIVGNVLPKSQLNKFAGLNLPWALKDSQNWRVTHYWAGRTMFVSGLLLCVLSLSILPSAYFASAIIIAALLPLIVGAAVSYMHSKRQPR